MDSWVEILEVKELVNQQSVVLLQLRFLHSRM